MNSLYEIVKQIGERNGFTIDENRPRKHFTEEEWLQLKVDQYNQSKGNLNEIDGYNCTVCNNRGYIAEISNGYDIHRQCKCMVTRKVLTLARKSGLGDIIADFTFDKFIATEQWQIDNKAKAMNFCKDDEAKWFFIGGQVGSGKTHLCTAIASYYIKRGCDVRYMLWNEESKKLKATVNDLEDYQDLIRPLKEASVLYIDDFFKVQNGEAVTKGDVNVAFEILNHRLMAQDKITIISSEKTLAEMLEYDEAVMSRIWQKTGAYKINIGKDRAKNYRLKNI